MGKLNLVCVKARKMRRRKRGKEKLKRGKKRHGWIEVMERGKRYKKRGKESRIKKPQTSLMEATKWKERKNK